MRVLGLDTPTLENVLTAIVTAPWILCFLYGCIAAAVWKRRHQLNEASFWRGWRRIEPSGVLSSIGLAGILLVNSVIRLHDPRGALLVGLLMYPFSLFVFGALYFGSVCGRMSGPDFPPASYGRTRSKLLLRLAKFSALAPLLPLVAFLIGVGR